MISRLSQPPERVQAQHLPFSIQAFSVVDYGDARGSNLLSRNRSLCGILLLDAFDAFLLVIDLSLDLRLVQSIDDGVIAFGDICCVGCCMSGVAHCVV